MKLSSLLITVAILQETLHCLELTADLVSGDGDCVFSSIVR